MSVGVGFGFYKYTELKWNENINNSYLIKSPSDGSDTDIGSVRAHYHIYFYPNHSLYCGLNRTDARPVLF